MNSENPKFEIGFWHPFGPHAGETPEQIIERKQKEIEKNRWTLWSFQFRNSLLDWYREIKKVRPNKVLVFCSEGKGARDPISEKKHCNYFSFIGENNKKSIPEEIEIPHPMRNKNKGSAFVVEEIIYPASFEAVNIEWLKDQRWQTALLPTRPEYLVRPGKGLPMRSISAILVLKAPYLAEVGIDAEASEMNM